MRRRKKMMYGMIAAAVCAFGGCGKPDTFPYPIQPESLVSDLVTEEKDSYEISGLNWDMSMAEARAVLDESYEILGEPSEDYCEYDIGDCQLEDGTPVEGSIIIQSVDTENLSIGSLGVRLTVSKTNQELTDRWIHNLVDQMARLEKWAERTEQKKGNTTHIFCEKESGAKVEFMAGPGYEGEEPITGISLSVRLPEPSQLLSAK